MQRLFFPGYFDIAVILGLKLAFDQGSHLGVTIAVAAATLSCWAASSLRQHRSMLSAHSKALSLLIGCFAGLALLLKGAREFWGYWPCVYAVAAVLAEALIAAAVRCVRKA